MISMKLGRPIVASPHCLFTAILSKSPVIPKGMESSNPATGAPSYHLSAGSGLRE